MIISIIHLMKGILYLGAAVAVLRCVAAFLPHNQHDIYDQLVFQPTKGADKAVGTSTASRGAIDAGIPAPRFGADNSLSQHVASPGSQSLDDIDRPPQKPSFKIGTTSSQWAITYTPYTDSLNCLSPSTIRTDVAAIARKGFSTIRLYSIDCSILQHMEPALLTHNLKLIVGIALDDGLDSASTQISELIAWAHPNPNPNETNKWPLIELIVIGSDAIFSSHTTPTLLATLLTTTRLTLRSHSYPGPLTTTEPLSILTTYAHLLCPTLDIPAATIHPFFHPRVSASLAGTYVSTQLTTHLATLCPNLEQETPIALETGWPSRGVANGAAVPGYVEQWVAVSEIRDSGVGGRSVFLGWGDEEWRDGGQFGVEGSWGCGHVFGGEGE